MAADKLTAKQQRFVEEYIIDLNATQAAIRAGYSAKNADKIGYELLGKTLVADAIKTAMNNRSKRTEITADKVLQELWHIATDDIKNYLAFRTEQTVVDYDDDGKPIIDYRTIVDIKDSDTIDTRNISEVSIGKDGQFKFKLYCRDNALLQVGKHLGMFVDKKEITGKDGGPIQHQKVADLTKLSNDELKLLDQLTSKIE